MDKVYSFRLADEDSDLAAWLDGLGKTRERSAFIIRALRFYVNFGDTLHQVAQNLEVIKSTIYRGGSVEAEDVCEDDDDGARDYVLSGIDDWDIES